MCYCHAQQLKYTVTAPQWPVGEKLTPFDVGDILLYIVVDPSSTGVYSTGSSGGGTSTALTFIRLDNDPIQYLVTLANDGVSYFASVPKARFQNNPNPLISFSEQTIPSTNISQNPITVVFSSTPALVSGTYIGEITDETIGCKVEASFLLTSDLDTYGWYALENDSTVKATLMNTVIEDGQLTYRYYLSFQQSSSPNIGITNIYSRGLKLEIANNQVVRTYRGVAPKPVTATNQMFVKGPGIDLSISYVPDISDLITQSGPPVTTVLPGSNFKAGPTNAKIPKVEVSRLYTDPTNQLPGILCYFTTNFTGGSEYKIDHIIFRVNTVPPRDIIDRNITAQYSHYFTIPYTFSGVGISVIAVSVSGTETVLDNSVVTLFNSLDINNPTGIPFMTPPTYNPALRPRISVPSVKDGFKVTKPSPPSFPWGFSGQTSSISNIKYDESIFPFGPNMTYLGVDNTNYIIIPDNYVANNVDLANPIVEVSVSKSTVPGSSMTDFFLTATVKDASGIGQDSCSVTIGPTTLVLSPDTLLSGDSKSGVYYIKFTYNLMAYCLQPVRILCSDIVGNLLNITSAPSLTHSRLSFMSYRKTSDTTFKVVAVVTSMDITFQSLTVFKDLDNTIPFGSFINGTSELKGGNMYIMTFTVDFGIITGPHQTFYFALTYGNGLGSITLSTTDINWFTDKQDSAIITLTPTTQQKRIYAGLGLQVSGSNTIQLTFSSSDTSICESISSFKILYTSNLISVNVPITQKLDCSNSQHTVAVLTNEQISSPYMVNIQQICRGDGSCDDFPMFGYHHYAVNPIQKQCSQVMATFNNGFVHNVDVSSDLNARTIRFSMNVQKVVNPNVKPFLSIVDVSSGHTIKADLIATSSNPNDGTSFQGQFVIPLNWGASKTNRSSDSFMFYLSNFVDDQTGCYYHQALPSNLANLQTWSSALTLNKPVISSATLNLVDRIISIIGTNLGQQVSYKVQDKELKPGQRFLESATLMVVPLEGLDISIGRSMDITIDNVIHVLAPITCSTFVILSNTTDTGMNIEPNKGLPTVVFKNVTVTDNGGSTVTTPFSELSKQTSFSIDIESIREIDLNDKLVKLYTSDSNLTWTVTDSNDTSSTYRHDFTQDKTSYVTVRVDMYKDGGSTQWANDTIKFAPSSTKYTIRLTNYQFSSTLNHLLVVFKSISQAPCVTRNESLISWGAASLEDMHWFVIPQHQLGLYGRFTNKVISDGRITSTANIVLSKAEPILIGINVPYFSQFSEIDPDFSVLVDLDKKTESSNIDTCTGEEINNDSDKIKPFVIPVAV
eukprot:gene16746-19912_t